MWIPFFIPTLLEIEGGKSFRPRQCTNWSILLQRCCRHLQSTSKIYKWVKIVNWRTAWPWDTPHHCPWFLSHTHSSSCAPWTNEVEQILYCSILHKADALQATTRRSYESHLAVRCWTIESNFSLLLNCTASPDNLVHMCRLSGSNWKPKRENTATLCAEL